MKRVFLIFLPVFLISCFNQGDCVTTSTSLARIALLKNLDGTPRSVNFLTVKEIHNFDTLSIYTDTTTTILLLPLNPKLTQSAFSMLTSDSIVYHITLSYTTSSQIVADDCGAFLYYKNLSVVESNFDSTKLINSQLLRSVSKNLQVYF